VVSKLPGKSWNLKKGIFADLESHGK